MLISLMIPRKESVNMNNIDVFLIPLVATCGGVEDILDARCLSIRFCQGRRAPFFQSLCHDHVDHQ
jgi:hypothetical protein